MAALTHLKSFQALELALRMGSLKQAAVELGLTQAAVGQRIKVLEDYLGMELLERGRAGLRPTAELTPALTQLAAAFDALAGVVETLDRQREADLHIAAQSDFQDLWLEPRLAEFRQAHPHIRFCINGVGDAPLRLGTADCEIGFGAASRDELEDVLFGELVMPIASPGIAERIGTIPAASRLEGFPLLHLDLYRNDPVQTGWQAWIARHGGRQTAPDRGMRFQRLSSALDALRGDAGVALAGVALLEMQLRDRELAMPFPGTGIKPEGGFRARYRRDRAQRPHVRAFRDWLRDEAKQTDAWLVSLNPGS